MEHLRDPTSGATQEMQSGERGIDMPFTRTLMTGTE
jgi:hypothetical protein